MEGVKHDQEKPRWSLLPWNEIEEVVEVLTLGSEKYEDDNWKRVPEAKDRYISAAMRHFKARVEGEFFDKETKKSHLAHAVCCLLFLMWHDDNPPESHMPQELSVERIERYDWLMHRG